MKYLVVILLLCCIQSNAQFTLDTRLRMSGDSLADKQILGVADPITSSDGVNAGNALRQELVYGEINGGSAIILNPTPAVPSYANGMILSFALLSTADSAVSLNVSGNGPIPILRNGTLALDSGVLIPNRPYHVIFSNGVFHLLTGLETKCPDGFEPVTSDYCMETQPTGAANFFLAARLCSDRGGRLCTMGEWMRGCKKLNLQPSISAWEWVDSAANNSGDAKAMGLDQATQSSPDCEYGRPLLPTLSANTRCCFSR